MRKLGWFFAMVATVALVGSACTSGGGGDDDDDDDDDDDAVTLVEVSGDVGGDSGGSGGSTPLVGATVEQSGTSNSVVTVNSGAFAIMVPQDEDVFLKSSASGFFASQKGIIATSAGITDLQLRMPADANVAAVEGALAITLDTSKGILALSFDGAGVDTSGGFTATISANADGSFAFQDNGTPTLTSTTPASSNQTLIFYNVDVGTSTVNIDPPGALVCNAPYAITSYRIDANTITNIEYDCP